MSQKLITKLKPEQEALIGVARKKWHSLTHDT